MQSKIRFTCAASVLKVSILWEKTRDNLHFET